MGGRLHYTSCYINPKISCIRNVADVYHSVFKMHFSTLLITTRPFNNVTNLSVPLHPVLNKALQMETFFRACVHTTNENETKKSATVFYAFNWRFNCSLCNAFQIDNIKRMHSITGFLSTAYSEIYFKRNGSIISWPETP